MATSSNPKKTLSSQPSSVGRPPQAVKFARRTSSGRVVSLSRDDDIELSGEFSSQNDYINYTVLMPPTPDNQPSSGAGTSSDSKPDGSDSKRVSRRVGEEGSSGGGGAKMDRTMSLMKSNNKSMLLRSQTGDFDHNRWLFETKGKYGIGNAFWSQEEEAYGHDTGVSMQDFMDKPWKPLTRKIKTRPSVLSPYRCTPICLNANHIHGEENGIKYLNVNHI